MDDIDDGFGIRLHTGGPLAVHHLLLSLAHEHRITLHADAGEVDHTALATEALEVWQTPPAADESRWRWMVLGRGQVISEAPGDPHRLRPHEHTALTVTRSTLPDRDSVGLFRKALRAAGASCTISRLVARGASTERALASA